ncbi:MAG: ABC transporter permease [Planctomycetes bacterium]|nr:ABC transporter permease [Planctomycetota bacterium]
MIFRLVWSTIRPQAAHVLLGRRYIASRGIVWLSVIGYAVGVMALIVVSSVMNGFAEQVRTSVRGSLCDLTITHVPLTRGAGKAPDFSAVRDALAKIDGIDSTRMARRISWFGAVTQTHDEERRANDNGSYTWVENDTRSLNLLRGRIEVMPCELVGIDLEDDARTSNFTESIRGLRRTRHVRDVPVIDPEDPFYVKHPPDEAYVPALGGYERNLESWGPFGVLGAYMLNELGLDRGDMITVMMPPQDLTASPSDLALGTRRILVSGTFRTGKREFDGYKVFLDRTQLAQVLGVSDRPEDYYTEIVLRVEATDDEELHALREDVTRQLNALGMPWQFRVKTWMEQRTVILQAINYEKKMIVLLLGLIVLVAGINMFTTLWMMVTEKTKDVGILSALGSSRLGILQLFLTMGSFIATIGGSLGLLGGLAVVRHLGQIEQFLFATFQFKMFNPEIYMFDTLPAVLDPEGVILILTWTLIGAVVFSVAPAIRAALKHPVQSLRYE